MVMMTKWHSGSSRFTFTYSRLLGACGAIWGSRPRLPLPYRPLLAAGLALSHPALMRSPEMQTLACLNSTLPPVFPDFKTESFTAHVFLKSAPLARKMLKILFNSTHRISKLPVEQSRKPGVTYPSQEGTDWKDKVQMLLAWPPFRVIIITWHFLGNFSSQSPAQESVGRWRISISILEDENCLPLYARARSPASRPSSHTENERLWERLWGKGLLQKGAGRQETFTPKERVDILF